MDIFKTSFSKKAVFLEKIVKTLFVGGHDPFEHKCSFEKNLNYRFKSIFIDKENEKINFYR